MLGVRQHKEDFHLTINHLEDHRDAHNRTPPLDTLRVIANCKTSFIR